MRAGGSRFAGSGTLTTDRHESWQPATKLWLHSGPPARLPRWGPRSPGDASAGAALLLLRIQPVFSVVAPGPRPGSPLRVLCAVGWRGASPVSVRHHTFTTDC